MKSDERPTLKTISELTGLAITTVSRALSGAPEIALKTRHRVASVAEEIGYVPDRAAQRLRTGKTKVVSLVLCPHQESIGFGNSLIVGLTRALHGSGYHLNITPSFSKEDELSPIKSIVRNKFSDGIIFTRTQPFDNRIRYLLEVNHPFISHGRTEFAAPHSYVDYDNQRFAYEAVKRLVEKKSKKICIILPPTTLSFNQHLHTGFMKAIRDFNVDFEIPENIDLDSESHEIRSWISERIKKGNAPDGFVCPGESSYLAITSGLRDQLPVEYVITHYNFVVKSTSGILDQLATPVDQIIEDIEMTGEALGKHMLDKLRNSDNELGQTLLAPQLKFLPNE